METRDILYWGAVAIVNLIILFIAFRKDKTVGDEENNGTDDYGKAGVERGYTIPEPPDDHDHFDEGDGAEDTVPPEPPKPKPPKYYKTEKHSILTGTKRRGCQCGVCGTINYFDGDFCEVCGNKL